MFLLGDKKGSKIGPTGKTSINFSLFCLFISMVLIDIVLYLLSFESQQFPSYFRNWDYWTNKTVVETKKEEEDTIAYIP